MSSNTLAISSLEIGYRTGGHVPHVVAGPIEVNTTAARLVSLIGPNGSGKSTLIRTLARIHSKLSGEVLLLGRNFEEISRRTMAQIMSIVLTESLSHVNLTVGDVVALGRHPHTGWFGSLSVRDRGAVHSAMASVGILDFKNRKMHQLSDGETQKVLIARALAQDTPIMLLDEPTAHLDIANRLEIIHLLRDLTRTTGKTIIQSTHELDMALYYSDELWILDADHHFFSGAPEDLVFEGLIDRVFGKEGLVFDMATGNFVPSGIRGTKISLSGDETGVFWTKRALERLEFTVITDRPTDRHVSVANDKTHREWFVCWEGDESVHRTIEDLLGRLTHHLKKTNG